MATTKFGLLTRIVKVFSRQALSPNEVTATFAGDDTDNHDYIVAGRGKGRATVAVHNKTNKTATVTIYGAHSISADIGDDSVFQIGTFDVLTTVANYETMNDPFPFYIVRVAFSATPDGENVIINVNLSAF